MTPIQLIDSALFNATSQAARQSERRRKNHNFHVHGDDPCNRLLNAIEPSSYVQPHCHAEPSKDETMVVVRGKLGLIVFDANGGVRRQHVLAANSECIGATIPHNTWHTVLALEPGTIFFEAKAGPYRPLTDAERAPWAPSEGSPEAERMITQWQRLFAGS